jgi:nitrogen regulatory protein PII
MYLIKANVSEPAASEVQTELLKLGITRMRLARISGYTRGCEREIVYRGVRQLVALQPEFELETFADNEAVDGVVDAILRISRGFHSDGYVTATPVEQCFRIKTGIRES